MTKGKRKKSMHLSVRWVTAHKCHRCHAWLRVVRGERYSYNSPTHYHLHSPYLAWEDGKPMAEQVLQSPHTPSAHTFTYTHTNKTLGKRGRAASSFDTKQNTKTSWQQPAALKHITAPLFYTRAIQTADRKLQQ